MTPVLDQSAGLRQEHDGMILLSQPEPASAVVKRMSPVDEVSTGQTDKNADAQRETRNGVRCAKRGSLVESVNRTLQSMSGTHQYLSLHGTGAAR
jgi:hypothetical protein